MPLPPVTGTQDGDKIRAALAELKQTHKTWQGVSDELGINRGLIWAVAKGKKRAPNSLRKKLGFECYAPAPVCAKCGQVHVAKRCTQASGKIAKPRTNWKRAALLFASVIFYQAKGN